MFDVIICSKFVNKNRKMNFIDGFNFLVISALEFPIKQTNHNSSKLLQKNI